MFSLLIKYIILICECLTYLLHNTIFSLVSLGIEDSKNPLKLYVEVDILKTGYIAFATSSKRAIILKRLKQWSSKSNLQTSDIGIARELAGNTNSWSQL